MKKVININFQGTIVPIEESSYDLLKQYIDSLRRFFASEESSVEIVNDIEGRISELFNERLKRGSTCITDDDVNEIIKNIGRPADLEENELSGDHEDTAQERQKKGTDEKQKEEEAFFQSIRNKTLYRDENNKVLGGVCSGIAAYFNVDPVIVRVLFVVFGFTGVGFLLYLLLWIFVPGSIDLKNGVRKRLYRNPDEKILGGVCSGLGSYFDLNPWLFRFIFLLPMFSFVGGWQFYIFSFGWGTFLVYIILWLVIPEAHSVSEKLQMKGEKVDINTIKNSVLQEMKDVGARVGKMGKEAGDFAAEKGPQLGRDIHQATLRSGSKIGDVIVTLFKIFLYFILGCIGLSVILALLAIAVVSVGMFPLKDFVLNDGWQSVYAWGTLIFFIGVPVIGIITFIIRRFARVKSRSNYMGWSFGLMWVLGWIFLTLMITSVVRDFRSISSMHEVPVSLSEPALPSLLVKPVQNETYRRNSWFRMEPFATYGIGDDTALVGNVKLRIKRALTDSFRVTVMKTANGKTRSVADTLAELIPFSIMQQDSVLFVDKAFTINKTDKFRNQRVEVSIYVPVGHHIKVDPSFGDRNGVHFGNNDLDWYDADETNFDFSYGVTYLMKEDGLYTLSGDRSSYRDRDRERERSKWEDEDGNSDYRYDGNNFDSLKDVQQQQLDKMQRAMDSTKAAQQKQLEKIKDSLRKAQEEIDRKLQKLNTAVRCNPEGPGGHIISINPFIMNI